MGKIIETWKPVDGWTTHLKKYAQAKLDHFQFVGMKPPQRKTWNLKVANLDLERLKDSHYLVSLQKNNYGIPPTKITGKKNTIVDGSEILLTSWGWFIRWFTGFYTFQVAVWDVFHQQYYHSKGTPTYAWSIPQTSRFTPKWKEILL